MGKRKRKKQQRRPKPSVPTVTQQEQGFRWKRAPRWFLTAFSTMLAAAGLYGLFPTLSINQDYSIDRMFPYNTSFSVTNEGFWPITDLSVVCGADFTMLPWTTDPTDKSKMDLHTDSNPAYTDFPKVIGYKHRITLPCNHNVIANGHRIAAGAELHIKTTYRAAGTGFRFHKNFELRTIEGWYGQQFWQFQ